MLPSGRYLLPGVLVFPMTKIVGLDKIKFGRPVIIDDFVFIYARDEHRIGSYVHIASFTSITGGGKLYMDDFTTISSGCRILTGTDDFLGAGLTNSTIPAEYRAVRRGVVRIERYAIIGANCVILPDVTIGEGCAVGAGSVVTRDLEPWGVYIGNRRIKDRRRDKILDYARSLTESMRERGGEGE